MVPKGTPEAIIDKLAETVPAMFGNKRVAGKMKAGGSPMHIMNRAEVQAMWAAREATLERPPCRPLINLKRRVGLFWPHPHQKPQHFAQNLNVSFSAKRYTYRSFDMNVQDDLIAVDAVLARAHAAQKAYEAVAAQDRYDRAAQAAAWAIMEPARNKTLAELAVQTTGLGNVPDKITKNHRKTLGLMRDIAAAKTCGVISDDPATGITEIARPVGVVGAVVPSTNPGCDACQQHHQRAEMWQLPLCVPITQRCADMRGAVRLYLCGIRQAGHRP